jgi:hypothetical protein
MVKDLVEAPLSILKIDGNLAEILYLLLLLAVLALLVLELLLKEGVFGQGFLELHLQPLHRNGVTLLHPLKRGLQLGSICTAEAITELVGERKGTKLAKDKRKLLLFVICFWRSATSELLSANSFSCELMAWTRSSTTFL